MIYSYFSHSDCKVSCSFCPIQASSPLQVKYADGELERLGVIFFTLITYFVIKMVPVIVAASVLLT